MRTQFKVPDGPDVYVYGIDYFKGVDLNNAAANVEKNRSPEAPNMIRDQVGKVRKRMGFTTKYTFTGKAVNGSWELSGKRIIHAGTYLYKFDASAAEGSETTELYSGMADARSCGLIYNGALYIFDGTSFLKYDGTNIAKVQDSAYVPTIIISRDPTGGGTTLEDLNLLGRKWKESFLGTASTTVYQLTTTELDADTVLVQVMNSSGEWIDKTENTDFTVNRTTGAVTFSTAPGASPVTGKDNVIITPSKTREGYLERINRMTMATLFGVNGSPDRIFCAGNPDYPNFDYYSAFNDPTYFADTNYCQIGQDDTEIMGYTTVGNFLAAHKSAGQDGRNVIIRSGTEDSDGNAVFKITNTLKGEGTVSKYAFASMQNEPLYLTRGGVYAITTAEVTGEKISELRSFYITAALQQRTDAELAAATAFVWRDFYLLAVGSDVYVLDGQQKEYNQNAPWSNYQYEAYLLNGISARVWWEQDGELWFGTADGKLCIFASNVDDPASYNDDGAAIEAYWDTPDISGKRFFENKTFRYISVRLAAAPVTGCKILAEVRGIWSQVFDSGQKARYFDWSYIDFSKFVFSGDRTPHTMGGKVRLKKVDKVRFRIRNAELNEPFGLYAFAAKYTETGTNYKK